MKLNALIKKSKNQLIKRQVMPFDKVKKILIIEDDPQISSLVQKGLTEENFETKIANNGLKGLDEFHFWNPDLIILDIMLPGLNGIQVCSKIRETSQVPILMLTALGTPENVAIGLDSGADDYLPKPVQPQRLLARVKALLRRVKVEHPVHETSLTVNEISREVSYLGQKVLLTDAEFDLLDFFLKNPEIVAYLSPCSSRWSDECQVI